MAPFRPTNLNKRAYPGNANVIGPTTRATSGINTTTCCSSTNSFGSCVLCPATLGRRCCFCHCPCCNICCSCPCTVCTRTTPSGVWSASEQYEARTRDAWGDTTSFAGSTTCLCCTNVGFACTGNIVDFGGNYICGASNVRWIVAPSSTQVTRCWLCRNDAVTTAQANAACGDWFIPTLGQLQNPGYICRTYWDSVGGMMWSSTTAAAHNPICGCFVHFHYGGNSNSTPAGFSAVNARAFRCVTY